MFKYLKKRKANKIRELNERVDQLTEKNKDLQRKLFIYELKDGKRKLPQKRRMMKVVGKKGPRRGGPPR